MAWDTSKVYDDPILSADWNAMVTDQKTRKIIQQEWKDGSNCSGSDKAVNRVLTLSNSATSASERVFVNGVLITRTTDYTPNHLVASSTITFLIPILNTMKILVEYYV